jgi:hypothetical protein
VSAINMVTISDCTNYISKLESIGRNSSPDRVILSASTGGYANTNYVVDGIRHGTGYLNNENFSHAGVVVSRATNGLIASSVPAIAILYADGVETLTNGVAYNLSHPTGATNLAGYVCWGAHSSLGGDYAVNGTNRWSGNSGWWIIETIESYNGQRGTGQGSVVKWFSSSAFGGTIFFYAGRRGQSC